MLESKFQSDLIKDLKSTFPGCIVLKNDPNYMQGIPDLIVLYKHYWAALECKAASTSAKQANQEWYIEVMNDMSFAAFVNPANREEILNVLYESWGSGG